jgi:hypothetical protein
MNEFNFKGYKIVKIRGKTKHGAPYIYLPKEFVRGYVKVSTLSPEEERDCLEKEKMEIQYKLEFLNAQINLKKHKYQLDKIREGR